MKFNLSLLCTWMFIIPYFHQLQVNSLVCRGIGAGGVTTDVEWMASLQLPRSHSTRILYMDSITNSKDGFTAIEGTPPDYLFSKYHSDTLGLTKRTNPDLSPESINFFKQEGAMSTPNINYIIRSYSELIHSSLNEFYVWFNDQSDKVRMNIGGQANYKIAGQRWSHSKMQFSTSYDNSGYLLDHSYTNTPFGFTVGKGDWRNFVVDSGLKGQHAFCFSYHPDSRADVIRALIDIRPKMTISYLHEHYWTPIVGTERFYQTKAPGFTYVPPAFIPGNIYDTTFQEMDERCGVEWQKLVKKHNSNILGIIDEPLFPHCTTVYDIRGSSNTLFKVITHKPIPLVSDVEDSSPDSAGISKAAIDAKTVPLDAESAAAYFPTEEDSASKAEELEKLKKLEAEVSGQPDSLSLTGESGGGGAGDIAASASAPTPTAAPSKSKGKKGKRKATSASEETETDSSASGSGADMNRELLPLLVKALRIGPDPWLEVSKALGVPLYVSTWHNLLPSIVTSNGAAGILNIYSHIYNKEIYQTDNVDHSKYAISTSAAQPWVCFGDTNRKASQTDHAGLEICFMNAALRASMLEMIHQIDTTDMINEDKLVYPIHPSFHPDTYYSTATKKTKVVKEEALPAAAVASASASEAPKEPDTEKRDLKIEEEFEVKVSSIEEAMRSAVPGDVIEWEIKESGMKAEMNARAISLSFDPIYGPVLQTPRGRLLYSSESVNQVNSDVKWIIENNSNSGDDDSSSKKRSNNNNNNNNNNHKKETYSEMKNKQRENKKKGRLRVKN